MPWPGRGKALKMTLMKHYMRIYVCIAYMCNCIVYIANIYTWVFVQRANKVNNRFMSLLKKDNRWVGCFLFYFFPIPSPHLRYTYSSYSSFSLCCILWLSLRLFAQGEGEGDGGRRGDRVTGLIYVCVWHLCKRCHKNFRRTVAKTHHQLQQQQ